MYALPETAQATAALWGRLGAAVRARLLAPPETLDAPDVLQAAWRDPSLLLGQTCGWPFVTGLRDAASLVATPVYAAPGCAGAMYRSAIIARAASSAARPPAGRRVARVAVNGTDSWSGCHTLRAAVAPHARDDRFSANVVLTGGHRALVAAVRAGRADLCAVACVTRALLRRHAPAETQGLAIVGWTAPVLGLPLISAARGPALTLVREAVLAVLTDRAAAALRAPLLIAGAEVVSAEAYAEMAQRAAADAAGYPALA